MLSAAIVHVVFNFICRYYLFASWCEILVSKIEIKSDLFRKFAIAGGALLLLVIIYFCSFP